MSKGAAFLGAKALVIAPYKYRNLGILFGPNGERSLMKLSFMATGKIYLNDKNNQTGFFFYGGLGPGISIDGYDGYIQSKRSILFYRGLASAFEAGIGLSFSMDSNTYIRFEAGAIGGITDGLMSVGKISIGF